MKNYYFILVFFISFPSFSQDRVMDSLYSNLDRFHNDSNLVNTYNKLAYNLNNSKLEMSLFFAEKAKELSKKINYKSGLIDSYLNCGIAYYYKGNYTKALKNHTKAAQISDKTIDNYSLSDIYTNIALVYLDLRKYSSAESYLFKALKIDKKRKDSKFIGDTYNNIGTIYKNQKNYKKALNYFNKSLYYRKISNDTLGLPSTLTNLGSVNIQIGNYKEAQEQLYSALDLFHKNNDIFGNALVYNCLGDLNIEQKNYKEAISMFNKSLKIAHKNNMKSYISYSYKWIAFAYEKQKNYKKAYYYHLIHTRISDEIYNSENAALLTEIQSKYETEKQKKQIIESKAELTKQGTVTNVFIFGFIFMIILVFFILKSYKMKIKNNKIILEQKLAVEEKNKIIEEKNILVENQHKDIRDSITYAERIQGAILPPNHLWTSILPNSFVLYQPKDILSGDFYWIAETEEYKFIAAADCTGHGVPGALISIVNYNLLNKAVLEKNIIIPGEILDAVNIWLTESLHQTIENSTVKDGMDISLISINKKTNEIKFSGANNPLFVYSETGIKEYKGDKFPVGSFVEEQTLSFKTISVEVNKGDMLYLFSDGYADQFGGEKGKKFKLKNLREEFRMAKQIPVKEQKSYLHKRFNEWKGDLDQVDDVLIIGIEL
jgi:serine phosphatase RsbU (regulator of sigma subunit)/tetratricopeptide (TPR) repeat protein